MAYDTVIVYVHGGFAFVNRFGERGKGCVMSSAPWATITVKPTGFTATIRNVTLASGKLYQDGDKDTEVSASELDGRTVKSGEEKTIYTCGRPDSTSGTEGQFDIYDGDVRVGTYSWECPRGMQSNTSTWKSDNNSYDGEARGGSLPGEALGNVTLEIVSRIP